MIKRSNQTQYMFTLLRRNVLAYIMYMNKLLPLHDVSSHRNLYTLELIIKLHWNVLSHPHCSPDYVHSNLWLFSCLEDASGEKRYSADLDTGKIRNWLRYRPIE